MTASRTERLKRARLYLIVSPEALGDGWSQALARALSSHAIDMVQLRVKTWRDAKIIEAAHLVQRACQPSGALFIVNDRPDVAAAVGADGVHVGQDDISVDTARRTLGPDRLVGCSTHDAAELSAAQRADYAGLGPCFPSNTKHLTRTPGGAALVRTALAHAPPGLPVFPIGGITAATLPELVAAGARRAAVGAGILQTEDPAASAQHIAARLGPPSR